MVKILVALTPPVIVAIIAGSLLLGIRIATKRGTLPQRQRRLLNDAALLFEQIRVPTVTNDYMTIPDGLKADISEWMYRYNKETEDK